MIIHPRKSCPSGALYVEGKFEEVFPKMMERQPPSNWYNLDTEQLQRNIRRLFKEFLPEDEHAKVAYAIKANPHPRILQVIREAGVDAFYCASAAEVRSTLDLHPGAEILYNNPVKPSWHIKETHEMLVDHYTVDMMQEVEKILTEVPEEHHHDLKIVARMFTERVEGSVYLSSKFGAKKETMIEVLEAIKKSGARPGVSMHIGSQNDYPETFERNILKMADIAREVGGVNVMNLGGGIPVREGFDPGEHYKVISETIRRIKKEHPETFKEDHEIILELGRAIVASAVNLVIPIIGVNEAERRVYIYELVKDTFIDHFWHDFKYEIEVIDREGRTVEGDMCEWSVEGMSPDHYRNVMHGIPLVGPIKDDYLVMVRNAGAYMSSISAPFCQLGPPYSKRQKNIL